MVSRKDIDKKAEEIKERREREGRGKSIWERAKPTLKRAGSAAKAGLKSAAKEIKAARGKGGKSGMMESLNRMGSYGSSSPRRRTTKRKTTKKKTKAKPRRRARAKAPWEW